MLVAWYAVGTVQHSQARRGPMQHIGNGNVKKNDHKIFAFSSYPQPISLSLSLFPLPLSLFFCLPSFPTQEGATPLIFAAYSNRVDICELLLRAGASPNATQDVRVI